MMIHIPLKEITPLLKTTAQNWYEDKAPRLGAALAYYVALSLAPIVVVVLAIAGLVFGAQAAQERLVSQIQDLVGYQGAKVVQTMIAATQRPSAGLVTWIGLITLFFSATTAASELRDALNTIWKVPEDTTTSTVRSVLNLIKERASDFALVVAIGLFLVASLIAGAFGSLAGKYLGAAAPPLILIRIADWVISYLVMSFVFAVIFKVLPAVPLKWNDVVIGALLTSLLFAAGKFLLALYLGKAGFTNTYGAAGSLVTVLVWVYYSSLVLFLGAEFTRAHALRHGSLRGPQLDLFGPGEGHSSKND